MYKNIYTKNSQMLTNTALQKCAADTFVYLLVKRDGSLSAAL